MSPLHSWFDDYKMLISNLELQLLPLLSLKYYEAYKLVSGCIVDVAQRPL